MLRRIRMWILVSMVLAWTSAQAQAVETLSEQEMDRVIAGFLDASATVNIDASSTATGGDGSQVLSGTLGSFTGVAQVPVFNGLTVKNVTGDAAAAHSGGTATVDNSDHSDNSDQIQVTAGGDSAAAHSGGTATVDNSDNSVNTLVGGSWTATGHGNNGDAQVANDSGTITETNTLTLSDQAQQNVNALFLVNTLGQVGNGFNLVSTVNDSGGGLIGNFNAGAIVTSQMVANFSTVNPGTQSITVSPSGSSVGGSSP